LCGLALVLFLSCTQCGVGREGVLVTVRNSQAEALETVSLRVTGNEYQLGDIAPGAATSARVHPTSDSHVVVVTKGVDARPREVVIDTYLERGSGGTLEIELLPGGDTKVVDRIRL
jgi:hypothetical protein